MDKKLVVIIGSSASGKSEVLRKISEKGYNICYEKGEEVLREREEFEATYEEIEKRQEMIYNRQKKLEDSCVDLNFLERSLVDCLAFSEYFLGKIPDNFDTSLDISNRYSKVFNILPPKYREKQDFGKGSIRVEDSEQEAEKIHQKVLYKYKSLGYKVIDVPFSTGNKEKAVEERANCILNYLKKDDLIK